MGQALAGYGMTPMAGRMWGWLLICEPPEQTAADLAEALQASRGAISGTARILASAGMIRRTTRRGDRREYFSAPPETFDSFLESAGRIYRRFREIAERGLDRHRRPAARRRGAGSRNCATSSPSSNRRSRPSSTASSASVPAATGRKEPA